jgi:asparagine synthase (glutamine-hydrolysing)
MTTLGGLVSWQREGTVQRATLTPLARRLGGSARQVWEGRVGFVTPADALESAEGVWGVGDLELTNARELAELAGRRPGQPGVLAALYAREGIQGFRRLRGGFALALWDRRRHTLVLAVDPFGIKRLFYTTHPAATAFASRAGLLRDAPGVSGDVEPGAVLAYLAFGFIPAGVDLFRNVRRLPPGHVLVATDGRLSVEPYWDLAYTPRPWREREAAAAVYGLAEAAVQRALGDTPAKEVGAFLSGGTDSSTVLGLMSRLTGERIHAFSIGFREPGYDELHYAELAARHFGAAHDTRILGPAEALTLLPRLAAAYDEPFGNNSALGTLACAELARDCGITKLLAGDGGDEIFGGNERYRTDRVYGRYQAIPAWIRRGLIEPLLRRVPDTAPGPLGRARRYVRRASLPNPQRFFSWEFFFVHEAPQLLAPEFLATVDPTLPDTIIQAHYARAAARDELDRLLYLDLKLAIGDNDLLKVTRTAELAGVTVRFPLLDVDLVEHTATWPAHFKVRGLDKRYLFKRAFRDLLPRETLAKRKHGFGVPTATWLRSDPGFRELGRDLLLSPGARVGRYFRRGALERLFSLHDRESSPYYGDRLWTVLMLELWHRHHLGGGPA